MEFLFNPAVAREEWNEFVVRNGGSFLQSFEWASFQEKAGNTVARIVIKKDGVMVACANAISHTLPFHKAYWYVPYGPVIAENVQEKEKMTRFFYKHFARSAGREAIFIKIEPEEREAGTMFAEIGTQGAASQPQETVIIDCALSEKELLAQMKPKTRYNIKVAERHGVKIISLDDQTNLDPEIFLSLLSATAIRHRFRTHTEQYYRTMLETLVPKEEAVTKNGCFARLFFAQYEGAVIASALVVFFGRRATYVHGASDATQKNIMAPYMLHWEIMKYVKQAGYAEYDLWGVATERSSDEIKRKWGGFSRFKLGFGGNVVERPGAYDFTLRPLWYIIYRGGRKAAHIRSWLKKS